MIIFPVNTEEYMMFKDTLLESLCVTSQISVFPLSGCQDVWSVCEVCVGVFIIQAWGVLLAHELTASSSGSSLSHTHTHTHISLSVLFYEFCRWCYTGS